jgi:Na+-transporting methylmalonyl-CoA/oxaloacetate decarboxylase gamma subunit
MSRQTAKTVAAVVFIVISLTAYIVYRTSTFEQSYTNFLSKKFQTIYAAYNSFTTTHEFTHENISSFLAKTTEENGDLSLIAVKDNDLRPVKYSANDKILSDSELSKKISEEVFSSSLPLSSDVSFMPIYLKDTGKRFYIFTRAAKTGSVIAVYPRRLPALMIAKMLAEAFAVVAMTLILFAFLLKFIQLLFMRREKAVKEKSSKDKIEKSNASRDEHFYSDLQKIVLEFDAVSVTLLVLPKKNNPARQFGWNQGKFFSAKLPNTPSVETTEEMLREIAKGTHVIRDRGKRIIVPVLSEKFLHAVLALNLPQKCTGSQINAIKKRAATLAKHF